MYAHTDALAWDPLLHYGSTMSHSCRQGTPTVSAIVSSYPAGAAAGYCILLVSAAAASYPAGAAAGSCILLVSSFFLLSSFFFLLLLATRLFHILPYIRFWPNLVKVTSTLTTTHAHKMVGSGVTMGSLGSKRSFSPKRHQVLQIT